MKRIGTRIAEFTVHRLAGLLLWGLYHHSRLPAACGSLPGEALLDTLYLAPARSRLFATLPEVKIPRRFDLEAAAVTERRPGYNPSAIH